MLSNSLLTPFLLALTFATCAVVAEPARLSESNPRRLTKREADPANRESAVESLLEKLSTEDNVAAGMKGIMRVSNGRVTGYLVQNVYEAPPAIRMDNQPFFRQTKWLGIYEISTDISQAVNFTLPASRCGLLPELFEIGAEGKYNVDTPKYPLLGIGSSAHNQFRFDLGSSKGFGGLGSLSNADSSPPKTFEQSGTTQSYLKAESSVWSMNCDTNEVKATWTNYKGRQTPVYFMGTGTHQTSHEIGNAGVIRVVADPKLYDAVYYPNLKTRSTPFTLTFMPL